MKKLLSLAFIVSLTATLLIGCTSTETETPTTETPIVEVTTSVSESIPEETTTEETTTNETATASAENTESIDINIFALKGPTAMGMVQFMDEVDSGSITDNQYNISIKTAIDEVTAGLAKGNVDFATVPANLASVLYNNTDGDIQVLAINTLGVLYIAESGNTISTIEDLRGKTIFASGKNATPEYALNYILTENGLTPGTDVTIEWKSEQAECVAALSANENAIAMLPQPFATIAQIKNEDIRIALNLTEEWNNLQVDSDTPSTLVTGVVVGRKEFIESNPDAVSAFLDHYKTSVTFVNSNTTEAAKLIEKYNIVPAAVATKALPACNIAFIEGKEMKTILSGYLTVLSDQNPKSIGGKLPADDFYYAR